MALLGQMQSLLAALYDAPVEYDVHDYLITDPAHAAALQELPSPPGTDEQLLIATTDDGVELGLYVDAAVLERDAKKRKAMYEKMQADFRKDSPFIMLFQQTEVAAMRSNLQGVKIGPTSDSTYMHKVT